MASGAPLTPGNVVAGRYRIDRPLGEGGMGVVVAALDLQLERRVALKVMLPALTKSRDACARFEREARAVGQLKSEHVAHVYDVGRLDDGTPYMVLEYLDGSDLAALLARDGPLSVGRAVEFVLQACDAVAEAHAAGIIHRDLKPHNLFLTRRANGRPLVKVLDFGISKISRPGSDLTKTKAALGSPLYMAPEQMRSARAVDGRSDLWAIGVILFELLTGRTPFIAESEAELALMIAQDAAPRLGSLRPDTPAALSDAIARCLEKEPAARFATVQELMAAIESFAPAPAKRSASDDGSSDPGRSHHPAAFVPTQRALAPTIGATTGTDEQAPLAIVIGETARARTAPSDASRVLPAARTNATWGNTNGVGRARRSLVLPVLAGGGVLGAVIGVAVLALRAPGKAAPAGPATQETTPAATPDAAPSLTPLTPQAPAATTPQPTPAQPADRSATPLPPPPRPARPRPPAPSSHPADPLQRKW